MLKRKNVEFPTLRNVFSDFFEDTSRFIDGDMLRPFVQVPATNILEKKDSFQIELAIPGMSKNDFNIDIDNGFLTISSEKETSTEEKEENYTRREYNFNSFKRTFTLPETVKEEDIKAKYIDGVLKIMIPKKEEAKLKAKKHIAIN